MRNALWIGALIVLCAFGMAPKAKAQTLDATSSISDLINQGLGTTTVVRDEIFRLERRLEEWEAALGSGTTARPGLVVPDDGMNSQLARHPVLSLANSICIDAFRSLAQETRQPAVATLEDCIEQIRPRARFDHTIDCASLYWTTSARGDLRLEGSVPSPDDRLALARRFGAATVASVEEIPFPACAAIEALEVPMTSSQKPEVSLLSRRTRLGFGDSLAFEVITPDFFAFVYIMYFQADGSIVNLTPQTGLMRRQYNPRTQLVYGDGVDGRQTYTAAAPAGDEAIVIVASRSPIDALDALETGQNGQYAFLPNGNPLTQEAFLDLLAESMKLELEAGQGTREISAEVLHLTVVP